MKSRKVWETLTGIAVGITLCGAAWAHPPTVEFVNAAHEPVIGLHIASPAETSWGHGHLTGPLDPGDAVAITATGHRNRCRYDVRAVFAGGGEAVWESYDLCGREHFVIRRPD